MQDEEQKCLNRAVSLLSRVSYSKKRLNDKLRGKFAQSTIDATIKELEELGLYSETNEIGVWLRYYQGGKKSRREIEYALLQKGFPKNLILEQLESLDEQRDEEVLKILIEQLKNRNNLNDEKIFMRLLRKGFASNSIKKIIREFSSEDSELY